MFKTHMETCIHRMKDLNSHKKKLHPNYICFICVLNIRHLCLNNINL